MKPSFYAIAFLLFVSSGSNPSKSTPSDSIQKKQLGDSYIVNIIMTVDKGETAIGKATAEKNVIPTIDLYAKYTIAQHQLGLEPKESNISDSLIVNTKHDLKVLNDLQGNAFEKAFIDAMIKDHLD